MRAYSNDDEEFETLKTWITLYHCFSVLLFYSKLRSSDVDRVDNAMMLLALLHTEFAHRIRQIPSVSLTILCYSLPFCLNDYHPFNFSGFQT